MKLTPAQSAELVALVAHGTRRARVALTGRSMRPLLRAGMVVDVEPLAGAPRLGDILVFKGASGLVAHRFFASRNARPNERGSVYLTAGDAFPDRADVVAPDLVVGRVSAVWSSAAPDARRIDGPCYRWLGTVFARTRRIRTLLPKFRTYATLLGADPARVAPPPAFAALMAATRDFERGRYAAAIEQFCSVPRDAAIEMARKHHLSGLVSSWLDEAAQAGVAVPGELREAFRRIRWTNALQAGRVLACAGDVRDRFVAAGIPYILLKGGARLASGQPGADLQFSGDVDVLVPSEMIEPALAALRDAGYRELTDERARAKYAAVHHHRGALCSPNVDVPVEVHGALASRRLVSRRLDYAALAPYSELARGPLGEVRVLGRVGSAAHLAYHARDLHVWRDIVLLSRLLRGFDGAERARFDAFVRRERRDGLRLTSAVAAADAIAFDAVTSNRDVRRYLSWAAVREDLPAAIAHHDLAEAVIGRCPMPELRLDYAPNVLSWLREWIRNLALLVPIARAARFRRERIAR
jgi:hypothetical protein